MPEAHVSARPAPADSGEHEQPPPRDSQFLELSGEVSTVNRRLRPGPGIFSVRMNHTSEKINSNSVPRDRILHLIFSVLFSLLQVQESDHLDESDSYGERRCQLFLL